MAHKYFNTFYPDAFEKTFIKRNSKQSDGKGELIENNLEGLSQYFTAPNIRNKVNLSPIPICNLMLLSSNRLSILSSWLSNFLIASSYTTTQKL